MTKVHLLGADRSYDRNVQSVSVNQIVVLEGYAGGSYVVYDITRDRYGFTYHLVHTSTYDFNTSNLIRPLTDKFGRDREKKAEQEQKDKEAREEYEHISKIGAERLRPLIPSDAKAVIVGELRVSECDSYTDYYDYRIERTVILGFSKHTRNLFSEMRKCAANFEGTAHLAENNADYEHRENYSMGDGMYLGRHKYNGWTISKEPIYNLEKFFERFAHTLSLIHI